MSYQISGRLNQTENDFLTLNETLFQAVGDLWGHDSLGFTNMENVPSISILEEFANANIKSDFVDLVVRNTELIRDIVDLKGSLSREVYITNNNQLIRKFKVIYNDTRLWDIDFSVHVNINGEAWRHQVWMRSTFEWVEYFETDYGKILMRLDDDPVIVHEGILRFNSGEPFYVQKTPLEEK